MSTLIKLSIILLTLLSNLSPTQSQEYYYYDIKGTYIDDPKLYEILKDTPALLRLDFELAGEPSKSLNLIPLITPKEYFLEVDKILNQGWEYVENYTTRISGSAVLHTIVRMHALYLERHILLLVKTYHP